MQHVIDLFAGPGGWDVAAATLDLHPIGIEVDIAACDTRYANGLTTRRLDLTACDPNDFDKPTGLIASPPCQPFSRANDQKVDHDSKAALVEIPMRWVEALQPEWVAFEQVRGALPYWQQYSEVLERYGYWTWTGNLNAADYGVPQNRRRAVLIASRSKPVHEPTPLDTEPPTMAEALGWTANDRWWHELHHNQSGYDANLDWPLERPACTIAGRLVATDPGANANRFNGATKSRNDGYRITAEMAAALQTFPPGYVFKGTKAQIAKQIGNAVPPRLAAAIINEATS